MIGIRTETRQRINAVSYSRSIDLSVYFTIKPGLFKLKTEHV